MTSLQQVEIEKYHDEIVDDVTNLIEKYKKNNGLGNPRK